MKKLLTYTGIALGVILLLVGAFALYVNISGIPKYEVQKYDLKVEVTPERVEQGQKIANMECVACHAAEDGRLTGRHMSEAPAMFGKIISRNITNDPVVGIGTWTDGELYTLLRTGVARDGQYIPPYMAKFPLASDEDIYSIIAWLRSDKWCLQASQTELQASEPSFLVKMLSHTVFKPLPMPAAPIAQPDTNDAVAHGKYLSTAVYACFGCHSEDFTTMNVLEPEKSGGYFGGGNQMIGLKGETILTSNLTFDETGIGQYTPEQFIDAVRFNKKRDGTLLRYPMIPHTQFTDSEARAIYEYLKTVPKISRKSS